MRSFDSIWKRGGRVVSSAVFLLLVGISDSRAQTLYTDNFDDGDLSEYGQPGWQLDHGR